MKNQKFILYALIAIAAFCAYRIYNGLGCFITGQAAPATPEQKPPITQPSPDVPPVKVPKPPANSTNPGFNDEKPDLPKPVKPVLPSNPIATQPIQTKPEQPAERDKTPTMPPSFNISPGFPDGCEGRTAQECEAQPPATKKPVIIQKPANIELSDLISEKEKVQLAEKYANAREEIKAPSRQHYIYPSAKTQTKDFYPR